MATDLRARAGQRQQRLGKTGGPTGMLFIGRDGFVPTASAEASGNCRAESIRVREVRNPVLAPPGHHREGLPPK